MVTKKRRKSSRQKSLKKNLLWPDRTSGKILVLSCLIVGSYILFKGFMIAQREIVIPKFRLSGDNISFEEIVFPKKEAFDAYAAVIGERDIFDNPYSRSRPQIVEKTPEIISESVDLKEKYKLVGIVIDGDPVAIVEKMENQETLFLSIGDKIDDAALESIEEDHVVFLYRNKHVSLKTE